MSDKQKRIIVFTIGLLTGVLVCFGVFITFYNNPENTNENVALSTDEPNDELISSNKSKSLSKTKYKPSNYKIPRNKSVDLSEDSLLNTDLTDTLVSDSLEQTNEIFDSLQSQLNISPNSDEILVMKDEIIIIRNITPSGKIARNENNENLDSLLVDNNSSNKAILSYRVEFWKSPINYSGYKMNNNKIVLFGIYEYTKANLSYDNNNLLLEYHNKVYKLENTSGFEALVPIKY